MVRRNALVMLMCMELMLNGVILSLVTFAERSATYSGAVLVFLVFVSPRPRSPRHPDRAAAVQAAPHPRRGRLLGAQDDDGPADAHRPAGLAGFVLTACWATGSARAS